MLFQPFTDGKTTILGHVHLVPQNPLIFFSNTHCTYLYEKSDAKNQANCLYIVDTKVTSYLEQGQRLESLSWRLWHLQNLMVDTDNAKSKRELTQQGERTVSR